ncbi:MAG TPA: hypothetical protein VFA68_07895 [Terriglobales bacterium]|nr:hypothetical protein [Terriglobales bacterium]
MRNFPRLLVTLPLVALLALAGCGGGSNSPAPRASAVQIAINSPTQVNVPAGSSHFFTAIVTGTTNGAVTWQAGGVTGGNATVGTIVSGDYVAPDTIPSPATVTITAIAQADTTKMATATATITIGVAVSPSSASLNIGGQQANFNATVTGTSNTGVDWSVSGVPGGNTQLGTIVGAGGNSAVYTSPAAIPSDPNISITATSQADPTQSGSASCILTAGGPSVNQAMQNAPIKLGTSGGNSRDTSGNFCCSGTLGALVKRGSSFFVLSNNHVLAKSDKGTIGDPVTQPGLVDTNCNPGQTVANLTQFAKLESNLISGGNPPLYSALADTAIAQIVSNQVDTTGAILQLGAVSNGLAQPAAPASTPGTPTVGMAVAKSGRTTGLTCGSIGAFQMLVDVDYDASCGSSAVAFTVQYSNQIDILSSTFSAAGDSGSLIVDAQTAQAVGLLYAGSSSDTVANPIQDVLTALADSKGVQPTIVGGATHAVSACTGTAALQAASIFHPSDPEMLRAIAAKENHASELMKDHTVIGVGVGASDVPGQAAVVILVEKGKPMPPIPAMLDGVPTKVRFTDRIRAFGSCPKGAPPASSALPFQ